MSRRVQIVANPSAGSFNPKLNDTLAAAFVQAGAVASVTNAGPNMPLAILPEAETLCVVGGDGSIRHAVSHILETGSKVSLAAWPGGTVNLFQREHIRPTEVAVFAQAVLAAKPVQHFAVMANDSLFLGCASIGPDARAVAALSDSLKRFVGRAAYGVALLKVLINWERPSLQVQSQLENFECEAVYLAKGKYFAGPWSFAPQADRTVPTIFVLMLKRCKRRDFVRFLWKLVRGADLRQDANIMMIEAASCCISSNHNHPIQLDGDAALNLPLALKISERPFPVV